MIFRLKSLGLRSVLLLQWVEGFKPLILEKRLAFAAVLCYNVQARKRNAQNLGVAQLVARYLGVVEAASSSLVTQTK